MEISMAHIFDLFFLLCCIYEKTYSLLKEYKFYKNTLDI